MIGEDELIDSYGLYDPYEDDQSENGIIDMDFLEVELVRSKCLLVPQCLTLSLSLHHSI